MRIIRQILVLLGPLILNGQFALAAPLDVPHVKVKTTLTLIGSHSEVLLDSVSGTLTLMNPHGREKLPHMGNTFAYNLSPTSSAMRTIDLPALSFQREFFDVIATGLVFQHDHERMQVGKVIELNLRVRRQPVDIAKIPGHVGVLTLGAEIQTNLIEGYIVEGSMILSFARLSNRVPSERLVEFSASTLPDLALRNQIFRAFQKPADLTYFVPDTDQSVVSVVLPIGVDAKGSLLFLDEGDLADAMEKGGAVKVFADSKKFVQSLPTEEFNSLLLGVGRLSVDTIYFDTVATFEVARLIHGNINENGNKYENLWRGMQMIRLLASESHVLPALGADELMFLKCSSVFWPK